MKCFIENDYVIDGEEQRYILRSIWKVNRRDDMRFEQLFDVIITDASSRRRDVWNSINASEFIFIKTAFIGESSSLLEDMCEMAIKMKVRDKTIINFKDSDSYLHMTERGLRMLDILKARNNVKYISQDTEQFRELTKLLFHE